MQSPQSPGICDSARETDVNQTVEQQTENSASKEKKLTKGGKIAKTGVRVLKEVLQTEI